MSCLISVTSASRRRRLSLAPRSRAHSASIAAPFTRACDHILATVANASRRLRCALALALLGAALSGCSSDTNLGPVTAYEKSAEPYTENSGLGAGDVVKINVYGESNLSGAYEISPQGMITMPLLGAVKVVGLSPNQIATTIANDYRSRVLLMNPKVTVTEVSYRPIYIIGEVEHPGKYPFAIGTDVLNTVATAGGFTYRADKNNVLIRHGGENVWQQYSLSKPLPVAPGDLIRVRETYF